MIWKTNKYNAKKTTIDGHTFDSKKEATYYTTLKLLEKGKKLKNIELQVPFIVIEKSKWGRPIKYICDFVFYDIEQKKTRYVDVKGYRGGGAYQIFKLKKRLMAEKYGIEVEEI